MVPIFGLVQAPQRAARASLERGLQRKCLLYAGGGNLAVWIGKVRLCPPNARSDVQNGCDGMLALFLKTTKSGSRGVTSAPRRELSLRLLTTGH